MTSYPSLKPENIQATLPYLVNIDKIGYFAKLAIRE